MDRFKKEAQTARLPRQRERWSSYPPRFMLNWPDMQRISFAAITLDEFDAIVSVRDHGLQRSPWDELSLAELTPEEQQTVDRLSADLRRYQPSLVNEATVFARSVYPMLVLAEAEGVQALAGVPLSAQVGDFELAGIADGALGRPHAGELRSPFLVVVEAKRGIDGVTPVAQLYAELLVAARLNAMETKRPSQHLFGCYTIADNWTFVEVTVDGLDGARPTFSVTTSQEYKEKAEAATIARILKSIVAARRRERPAITQA